MSVAIAYKDKLRQSCIREVKNESQKVSSIGFPAEKSNNPSGTAQKPESERWGLFVVPFQAGKSRLSGMISPG